MPVIEVNKDDEFKTAIENAGDKLIVIDFFATWCGPCVQIAPKYAELSDKYASAAVFLKVDVEKCQGTARAFQIEAMPTFAMIKAGGTLQVLHKVKGANPQKLEEAIIMCLAADGGSETQGGGCPINGQMYISEFVDDKNAQCMNEKDEHKVAALFDGAASTFLESDCDEQLLISIGFKQAVKIHSICFGGAVSKDDAPDGSPPKTVKLFVNHAGSLDFDDVESTASVQTLELTPEQVKEGSPVELRYVKFQNVTKLTLFVADNQEDSETTVLSMLQLIGTPRDKTDMKEFKRVSGQVGERE